MKNLIDSIQACYDKLDLCNECDGSHKEILAQYDSIISEVQDDLLKIIRKEKNEYKKILIVYVLLIIR